MFTNEVDLVTGRLIICFFIFVPLGIWKAGEIVLWVFNYVSFQ